MSENEQHREESWNKLVQKLKKHEFPLLDYNALVDTLRDIDMILDHTEGNEKKIKEIEAIVYKTLQRSVQPQHTTKEGENFPAKKWMEDQLKELRNITGNHTTKEKSEAFYCKEQGNVGYTCEEQCPACNKAENMPDIPRETSEEERISEIIEKARAENLGYSHILAAKAIKEYYHTEIIEPLKKENKELQADNKMFAKMILGLNEDSEQLQTRIQELEKELAAKSAR